MSEELKKLIQDVGIEIQPKLEPKPGYPVRNAYAHIFGVIKEICQVSYSGANPDQVRAIVEAIRRSPNDKLDAIITSAKQIYETSQLTE